MEIFSNRVLAKLWDKLFVHCLSAKETVIKLYGISNSSVEVIPHGNYIQNYENRINKTRARDQSAIINDFVFLYFGVIRPYKGINKLIDAFDELSVQNAELLIVGNPLNEEIADGIYKKCKNKNIKTIFKFVPDDEIQVYMNAADVIVLPYTDVLTSGTAILGMSFRKPIIAQHWGVF